MHNNVTQLPDDLTPRVTQRRASDPDVSVWVNASAGSGKTTVLTARFLRLLLAGVEPQRILCITFTRAAAAEMANRIQKRLALWATCDDDVLRQELDNLHDRPPFPNEYSMARRLFVKTLSCAGGLRIRTIHAFCQEILGRFPLEAGLAPHFNVIEEGEAADLREECLAAILRQATQDPESPLGHAVDFLATSLADAKLLGAAKSFLNQRAQSQQACDGAGSVDALIKRMRHALALEADDSATQIMTDFVKHIPASELRVAIAPLATHKLKKISGFVRRLQHWLADIPLQPEQAYTTYCPLFLTKDHTPLDIFQHHTWMEYPLAHGLIHRELQRIHDSAARLEAVTIAAETEAMLRLGDALITQYEARKNTLAALDFNDLITRTERLLQRSDIAPWVLYKLDGGLDHILVDEAQDTSRAQWTIVDVLTQEFFAGRAARDGVNRTLFVVGDEKQSIYSFQNADPEAFIGMYDHFAARITAAQKTIVPVPLHVSFRSARAILQSVDDVFSSPDVMQGVSRTPMTHSAFHRDKVGHVEVWDLIKQSNDDAPKTKKKKTEKDAEQETCDDWVLPPTHYENAQDPQNILADAIARTIKQWIVTGEKLAGTNRAIRAGDIMILLNRRGSFADRMVRALKKNDVDVTGVDRMRLVQQLPVMDLIALIQFVLLPDDDLNFAALLRSPLLGISDDDLMRLAMGRRGTLWHALKTNTAHAGNNKGIFNTVHDYLVAALAMADTVTPFAFLAHVLNTPCPSSIHSGRHALWQRLGQEAIDPVQELLSAAQDFGARHSPSLQLFLHWLQQTNAEIKREMDAGSVVHGGGQVRIMTVHAAKGLEAPIVFLPDASTTPRTQAIAELLWYDDHGVRVPFYISSKPSAGVPHSLWLNARQKQMEEYRRLLYVAMTRAENRLYIGGWYNKQTQDKEQSWHALAQRALQNKHEACYISPNAVVVPQIVLADPAGSHDASTTTVPRDGTQDTLPAWARRVAPDETGNKTRILTPSHSADYDAEHDTVPIALPDARFTRGRMIHRLLQSLPNVAIEGRAEAAARFLASPHHNLTKIQQNDIANEVLRLMEHPLHAPLFGVNSRAEVPIIGRIGDVVIPGQIDRLCLVGDDVWIVDYKTNRPPPTHVVDIPMAYRTQLAAYRAVLTILYPQKKVRCFLLWTYTAHVMEVPAELLELSTLKLPQKMPS